MAVPNATASDVPLRFVRPKFVGRADGAEGAALYPRRACGPLETSRAGGVKIAEGDGLIAISDCEHGRLRYLYLFLLPRCEKSAVLFRFQRSAFPVVSAHEDGLFIRRVGRVVPLVNIGGLADAAAGKRQRCPATKNTQAMRTRLL